MSPCFRFAHEIVTARVSASDPGEHWTRPSRLSACLLVAIGALALTCVSGAVAADDPLPPEPTNGEWIQDILADDSLWFAASTNLDFEAVAKDLSDYPQGRRWVRVIDGKAAWVMYYVPGDLLGFEVDTHHYGALATDFRFSAGAAWDELAPVDAEYEEITGFEAKWMRLYRAVENLPAGTHFLRIEFPDDRDRAASRLTEVWLRCNFENKAPERHADDMLNPFVAAPSHPAPGPAQPAARMTTVEDTPPPPAGDASTVEPYVVNEINFVPVALSAPAPVFSAKDVEPVIPGANVRLPILVTNADFIADYAPLLEQSGTTTPPTNIFRRLLDTIRHVF